MSEVVRGPIETLQGLLEMGADSCRLTPDEAKELIQEVYRLSQTEEALRRELANTEALLTLLEANYTELESELAELRKK